MITFKNVTKTYNETRAVDGLDLDIKDHEFFVLIGPSGCGKTTTLKMINRLIHPTSGSIFIDQKNIVDHDIQELRWNIGYVLQQIALFPNMTVAENIAVVPELKKWEKRKIRDRVDELLHMVGLDPSVYRDRKPQELSGGQQQRIGVARALAADPKIILMDEPFSALDPISREKLQEDMLNLKKTIRKTIVFVTHDVREALKLGDRICLMKDGRVVQIGTPAEIIHDPADSFVRNFVGVQRKKVLQQVDLEELAVPSGEIFSITTRLSVHASLEEVLKTLSKCEKAVVEKSGEPIGIIDRKVLIEYMANRLSGRGQENE